MKICELFTSVQGESTYAGLPCTFIRLAGCNLRCSYCDTRYSFGDGRGMDTDEIISYVKSAGIPLVEVTGGEPLMQGEETRQLVKRLLDDGYTVLIETNGSYGIQDLDRRAVVILDIKTPGSGVTGCACGSGEWRVNDPSNFSLLKKTDEVKFVIVDRRDYEWARRTVQTYDLAGKCTVLFSPVPGMIEPRDLVAWILQDRLPVRLNLQIHKYIFGPEQRGV